MDSRCLILKKIKKEKKGKKARDIMEREKINEMKK